MVEARGRRSSPRSSYRPAGPRPRVLLPQRRAYAGAPSLNGLAFDHAGASLARAGVWNLVCRHGELDLSFTPSGTGGYDDLLVNAQLVRVGGVEVRIAGLAEIIRGELVVTPAASVDHGRVQSRLVVILASAAPADYLEIDLMAPGPVATRFELRDGVLVPIGVASGTTVLHAARPFVYEFAPSALLD